MLQNVHPRIDADQKRSPKWKNDKHHQDGLHSPRRAGNRISDGIADHQQHQGGKRRNLQALHVGQDVERIGAEKDKILERKSGEERLDSAPAGREVKHRRVRRLCDRALRQTYLEHDQERQQKKRDKPRVRYPGDKAGQARSSRLRVHSSRPPIIGSTRWSLPAQS